MILKIDVNNLYEIHKAAYGSTLKDIETEINAESIKGHCMYGLTPLHWAIKGYRLDNVEILIKKSKELNVDIINIPCTSTNDKKPTPIELALDKPDILKILIENGADFKDLKIDEDGNTILHKAVSDYIANKKDTHAYLIIAILKCAPEAAEIKNNKGENAWDLASTNTALNIIFKHKFKTLIDFKNNISTEIPEELRKKRLEKLTQNTPDTQTPVSSDNAITTPINDEESLPKAIFLYDRIRRKHKKLASSKTVHIDI